MGKLFSLLGNWAKGRKKVIAIAVLRGAAKTAALLREPLVAGIFERAGDFLQGRVDEEKANRHEGDMPPPEPTQFPGD